MIVDATDLGCNLWLNLLARAYQNVYGVGCAPLTCTEQELLSRLLFIYSAGSEVSSNIYAEVQRLQPRLENIVPEEKDYVV